MVCRLCPHRCGAARSQTTNGRCGMPADIYVSRIAPHFWEEPVISGKNGTAAVFFTGCTLDCIYCQNSEISQQNQGHKTTAEEIARKLDKLICSGCETVSFITPTHYIYAVQEVIRLLSPSVPVVFNTSGYERAEVLRGLEGYVDIYLPDFKYADNRLAQEYSGVSDYFEVADKAIAEMVRQTGKPEYNGNVLKSGTVVRNLVLPNHTKNSIAVIEHLSEKYGDEIIFSLMGQYIPHGKATAHPKLNRKITKREYQKVLTAFENSRLDGFCQELSSADEKYIPNWDF